MARKFNQQCAEGMLSDLQTYTTWTVCAGEPADASQVAGLALATYTVSPTDFSIIAGAIDGWRSLLNAVSDLSITSSGAADHVVLTDGVTPTSKMVVTTCDVLVLTAGGTVNIPDWSYTKRQLAP